MKLKTSFCNATVLKKNITRFAPLWALYSIVLLLMLLFVLTDNDQTPKSVASNLSGLLDGFAICNFCYAPLCALLLFGDLFKSRMCYALHAMPISRECWFFTHVISGLLFSLVPNTLFALACLPFLGYLAATAFWWLLGAALQYLFFFGTAVLAMYCVGNRFAMGLVYLIINGFSFILYGLIEELYIPMMAGVRLSDQWFRAFTPLVSMVRLNYIVIENYFSDNPSQVVLGSGWGYLGICAGVGIGLLALALVIYRRRNLECAGDFFALRQLRPIFLVLYSLCAATVIYLLGWLGSSESGIFFLLLGLAVGVYTGKMLLERTVRVFRKQTFFTFLALVAAMALSFVVIGFDLLGIVRWVPKASRVESVWISTDGYYGNGQTLTEPEEIDDVLMMHRHGLMNRNAEYDGIIDPDLTICYTLKNGTLVTRQYPVDILSEAGECLKTYISSPEAVLDVIYTENRIVDRVEIPDADLTILEPKQIQQLLDAILADCAESNLPQDWTYLHEADYQFWIELDFEDRNGNNRYCSIRASSEATHIAAWLTETYGDYWNRFEKRQYSE